MQLRNTIMIALAMMSAGCAKQACESTEKQPIQKPQIELTSDKFTPEALWAMGRIGSVQVDVETGWIAYTVSYYSVAENRSTTWIRIGAEGETGLEVFDEFVGSEPAWFGNSGCLAYLKDGKLHLRRDKEDVVVEGTEDVEGFLLSPMRDQVILIKQVKTVPATVDKYPDLPLASGRVVDDLMYKHWDEWTETAPQPFVCPLSLTYYGEGERIKSAKVGEGINILDGTAFECPMKPFGGVEQLAWNPNNEEIAYTCRKKTGLEYAISTNSDIYVYNVRTRTHTNLTEGMMGYDINPSYSPNGKYIAWQSMERDGYESDENRLFIMDLASGEKTYLSKGIDTDVDTYFWADDANIIYSAVWHATMHIYRTNLQGEREELTDGQYDYVPVAYIDNHLYYLRHSMCEANELYCNGQQLTFENKNIYDQVTMGTVVPRWQTTTDGKQMLTWIVLPPHFDPAKKYPTLLYCGYVVVAPNRRGLPGFGKAWNEEISGDYGGQCMRDYFTAIDEAVQNLPYVDKDRLGCVGASFGGFSVYWIAGHHDKRFKAFIAHDGIFNMEMQYLETEEKWFANWDMGGAYWEKDNKIAQRTFANSPHKFVDKWDTPILCIHGEKDYRILANQAFAAFDAAKMRGIDAELLVFPDENHWVLQPQNGILWQRTFIGWLDKYLK